MTNAFAALPLVLLIAGCFIFYTNTFLVLAVAAIAALFLIYLSRMKSLSVPTMLGLVALLTFPSLASLFVNGGDTSVWLRPIAFGGLAISAYMAGRALDDREFLLALRIAVVVAFVTVPLASVMHGWDMVAAITSGRRLHLAGGVHPNTLGLMFLCLALAVTISCQGLLKWSLVIACGAGALATSSRAAIVSIIIAVITSECVGKRSQRHAFVPLGLVAIGLLFSPSALSRAINAIFLLNDKYRGVNTGGSGRFSIWSDYFWLLRDHALFGLGLDFRLQRLGVEIYSHNLVLQLLSDAGIFNLICFGAFVMISGRLLWRYRSVPSTFRIAAALSLITYLSYGVFEGRAINIGNPLSAFVFICIFAFVGHSEAWRLKPRRREAQSNRREGAVSPDIHIGLPRIGGQDSQAG